MMTKATLQEELKNEIDQIKDEEAIEKIRIFIMGILTQQEIEEHKSPKHTAQTEDNSIEKHGTTG